MFWKIMFGLLAFLIIFLAVRARVSIKRKRSFETVESTVASPASIAMGELVAVAGGVYLSLVLLASFLKITAPEKISLLNMSMDPLALIAITIALLQPIMVTLYYSIFRR